MQSRTMALATACILVLTLCAAAQEVQKAEPQLEEIQKIEGTVRAIDESVLPGAVISVKGTDISAISDERGFYSLVGVPPGDLVLTTWLPGFGLTEVAVSIGAGKTENIDIVLDVEELSFEVTVSGDTPKLMSATESIGKVTVAPSQMVRLPSLGEKDIFRALQLMPGISVSNESSSGLYVRGGTPDQNLVLFDGFTAYDVDHFFGIFSAFNAKAVEGITLHKGGYESKYGGRLSSVLEMDGKSGVDNRIAAGGGLSFLSYNGYASIPIGKMGSFLFAGRKSFQSRFSDKIRENYEVSGGDRAPGGRSGATAVKPKSSFYDINAKAVFSPTIKDNFSLSFYRGTDDLDSSRNLGFFTSPFDPGRAIGGNISDLSRWGNMGMSANWHRNWNPSFFSSVTMAYSEYFRLRDQTSELFVYDLGTGDVDTFNRGSREDNYLRDITLRAHNFWSLGSSHQLEFGTEITQNATNYGFEFVLGNRPDTIADDDEEEEVDDAVLLRRNNEGIHYSFYLQDTWMPLDRLSITPGLRGTYFDLSKNYYADPRLSAIYRATDRLRFKLAGGLYHQFAKNMVREDFMAGNREFWTMADGAVVPVGSAVHFIAGVSYELPGYLFDVEAYRKNLRGLSELASTQRGRPPAEFNIDDLIYTGTGIAKGVEFLVQKKTGRNTGWLTYTLGRVENLFPQFEADRYPASHDSMHEFKIVDTLRFGKLAFSGTWVFATGKPYTKAIGTDTITIFDDRTFNVVEMGRKNGARMPDYHRLDLSATWDFYKGESNQASAGISLFNAYNRKNIWRKEYDAVEGDLIETDINYLGLTLSAFVNVDLSTPETSSMSGPAWWTGDKQKKSDPSPGKVYNFYGKVESVTADTLTVSNKDGSREFVIDSYTIKGSEFEPGASVHVYYREEPQLYIVTMVFKKISSWDQIK